MKNKYKFMPLIGIGLVPMGVLSITTSCNKAPSVTLPEYSEIYLDNSSGYELSPVFKNFGDDKSYKLELENEDVFSLNEAKNKLIANEKEVAGVWIQPQACKPTNVTLTTTVGNYKAQTKAIIKGSIIDEDSSSFDVGKNSSVTVYPGNRTITFKAILNGKYAPLYADTDRWFDFVEYFTSTRIANLDGLKYKVFYDGKDITDLSELDNGIVKILNVNEGAPKFEQGKELRFEFDTTDWTLCKTTYMGDIGIRFYKAD